MTLRNSHIVPAYLNKRQRHLVFGDKFKTELENNPAYATLGEEEVQLKHVDRRTEIPSRKPLINKAVAMMQTDQDWKQLPAMLEGLHKAEAKPDAAFHHKLIRKAVEAGQLGLVVKTLNRSSTTGITLKDENIFNTVLWGLHEYAQVGGWEEARVRKAIRYGQEIAQMLESKEHGTERKISPNDPRTRPATIAVYLELAAVLAQKYQGGQDVDGNVARFTERLMACFSDASQVASPSVPFPVSDTC